MESTHLGVSFTLICFQRLSSLRIATLHLPLEGQQIHHWRINYRSSRTMSQSPQYSCAITGYGPNCFTTFWTQLTYLFNWRTAKPFSRTTARGWDEPTSRCQTFSSLWSLGEDQPVIPRVTFIRWATTLPLGIVGSLRPTFVPDRLVGLSVKLPSAFTLNTRFPS